MPASHHLPNAPMNQDPVTVGCCCLSLLGADSADAGTAPFVAVAGTTAAEAWWYITSGLLVTAAMVRRPKDLNMCVGVRMDTSA